KMIAADADGDGRVSISDIVALRRMILGIDEAFASPELAWKFIPNNHTFSNPTNPWPIVEHSDVVIKNSIFPNNIEFMAIKIGDVDGSAFALNARNAHRIPIQFATKSIDNRTYDMILKIKENATINALEMVINLPLGIDKIVNLHSNTILLDPNDYFIDYQNRKLKISWHNNVPITLSSDQDLFSISYEAKNALTYDLESKANNFVYTIDNKTMGLVLESRVKSAFEVYQNEPNPFENRTRIRFIQPDEGKVGLKVYNLSGKLLYESSKIFEKGINEIEISKEEIKEKGIILYEMEYNGEKIIKKMLLI
ncbi:MAG TPA: T9SS type A sorting domain-containing protein, partial [Saprospiraceae bacterium]|nr:T9SS type A sorting domain-containing protein [Saprospiraceae bacterium]